MLEMAQRTSIPVVDLKNLYLWPEVSGSDPACQEVARSFGKALHEYGFAYLKNHGIPKYMIEDGLVESRKFFELPPEIKAKCGKMDVTHSLHGYNQPGSEQLDMKSMELREAFDISGANRFYPEEVPEFQNKLETLDRACIELDKKLLVTLAIALGLDDLKFFLHKTPQLKDKDIPNLDVFRTLYYPRVQDEIEPGTERCAKHTDYGTCTLLFQDQVGGLEVRDRESDWIQATPIPGTIVVNVGDLLELWTCGYLPATEHRVRIPEDDVRRRSVRQSMAFFLHPANDIVVEALNLPGVTVNTSRYKGPVSAYEHVMNKVKATYRIYA